MPRRSSKRRSNIADDDDDVDSDVENTSPKSATRSSSRRRRGGGGRSSAKPIPFDDDEEADDTNSDDVMAHEEEEEQQQQMMFCSQAPEMMQDILEVKESERSNLMKLSENQRNKLLTDLTRLVLFKGLRNESIDRNQCLKEAGINTKQVNRISSAAFDEVGIRLKNCFGFELRRLPAFYEKYKSVSKKYKDRYFLTNAVPDEDGSHGKAIHTIHEDIAIEKALIILILALIYCKGEPRHDGSRWIHDKDLYSLLHRVDENIPSEPPAPGSKRGATKSTQQSSSSSSAARFVGGTAAAQTPDVDALLHKFVHADYLVKEKASEAQLLLRGGNNNNHTIEETDFFYAMGPRSAIEIGRRQVIYYCSAVLGEEPTPEMLHELEVDEEDNDDEEEEAELSQGAE